MRTSSFLVLMLVIGCRADPKAGQHPSNADSVEKPTNIGDATTPAVQRAESTVVEQARPRVDTSQDSAFGLVHGDSTFEISGPSLLTAFPVTAGELDASEHAGEAIDNYRAYLARANPRLREAGVTVHVTNDAVLKWRDSLGAHSISTVGNYAILYVLVRPNGATRILKEGIVSDTAILDAARKHFGITLPERPPE